jgi:hypothetical protein
MSNLIVNTRDQQFVIFEQLDIENLLQSKRFKDFTKDDLLMIMNEAEKLAVNVIAPTLKEGGLSVLELFGAANFAFCMYPGLTHGAAGLIHSFGTEEQKNTIYCPEIYIQYMQIN